jgi:hypothetical protein
MMELLLTAILLAAVVIVIAGPLQPGRGHAEPAALSQRDAIEMAKDAKYREILDAELDFHTGKFSETDYREVDRQLRGEASELLRRIDAGETEAGRR